MGMEHNKISCFLKNGNGFIVFVLFFLSVCLFAYSQPSRGGTENIRQGWTEFVENFDSTVKNFSTIVERKEVVTSPVSNLAQVNETTELLFSGLLDDSLTYEAGNDYRSGILKFNFSDDRPRPPATTLAPRDETRHYYPECSMECEDGWLADGWCDDACNNEQCVFDAGDCDGWCGGDCRPHWPADGECDLSCYKKECDWDGGDCVQLDAGRKLLANTTWNETENFDYSLCTCPKEKLGNYKCDMECNTFECNQDGLDCKSDCDEECPYMWLADGMCDYACDTERCHFDKGDCENCSPTCRTWKLGNGICDEECLTDECRQDDGDCIGITSVSRLDYDANPFVYEFCATEFLNDDHCDLVCFNPQSTWDEGDCGVDAFGKVINLEMLLSRVPQQIAAEFLAHTTGDTNTTDSPVSRRTDAVEISSLDS